MWKFFFLLIFCFEARSQVFTEDMSAITRFMAEDEIDNQLKNPDADPIPGEFLNALVTPVSFDLSQLCPKDPKKALPANARYQVLVVTETRSANSDVPPQSTVIVAKFKPGPTNGQTVLNVVSGAVNQQKTTPGIVTVKHAEETSQQIIHFLADGTTIDLNTQVRAENGLNFDVNKVKPQGTVNPTLQVDLVNRMNVRQSVTEGTTITGSLENRQSTGSQSVSAIGDTKFQMNAMKAEVRLDSQITSGLKTYTGMNYSETQTTTEMSQVAGFNITIPERATILVFTGFTSRTDTNSAQDKYRVRGREYGVEYRTGGMKVFVRGRESDDKSVGRRFETGLSIDLNR